MPDAPLPRSAPESAWRVFAESVRGTGHRRAGEPGQDDHCWRIDPHGRLIAAVADGAGSSRFGGQAATVACRVAVDTLFDVLDRGETDGRIALRHAVRAAGAAMHREAVLRSCTVGDLLTTVIVLLATNQRCGVAQIGDGFALAVGQDGELLGHSSPQGGEFANQTVFLSDPGAADDPSITVWEGPIAAVALLTDGLQRLALQFPQRVPHLPFFDRIFTFGDRDAAEAQRQLSRLLNSERVAERTDDDLTMVVAWNRACR